MESVIKWQTGFHDIEGECLVTENNGDVTVDCWCVLEHYQYWAQHRDDEVTAWCKLSDIEPYKEETMDRKYNVEEYIKVWKETEKGLEVVVNDRFELKEDNGKFYIIKKQPQYPKTYVECAKILDCFGAAHIDGYKGELLDKLQELLICRNAYWMIAGGWKPDWKKADERKYCIVNTEGNIKKWVQKTTNKVLAFPTEEMRDVFYENFKELIEECKEFL